MAPDDTVSWWREGRHVSAHGFNSVLKENTSVCACACECVCVGMRARSYGVGWRELWTHIWLQGLSQTLGPAHSRATQVFQRRCGVTEKQASRWNLKNTLKKTHTAPFTHFLQEFALDSELPRGHFLWVLTLGLAGSVRVGNVDPEFTFLLFHREKIGLQHQRSWVKSSTERFFTSESASFSNLFQ